MAEKDEEQIIEDDEKEKESSGEKVEYVPVSDKKVAEAEEDDEDSGDDKRLSEENEDREELRRRRREEKSERAVRRKQAIERDKLELNFLRQRNEELEKRVSAVETRTARTEAATLDERIQEATAEARAAERIMAKAIEAGAGDDVTKALAIRDEAIRKVQQLSAFKQQAAMNAKAAQKTQQMDQDVAIMAHKWINQNSWYNPKGKDEDSRIVRAIDQGLLEDGFNPKTEAYWKELDKRIAKRLPDKRRAVDDYDDEDDGEPRKAGRKGPMIGSSREHVPSSTRKEVYVSPERKNAMIQAGVWDDPVLRQRYLKQYARWDRDNQSTR
jgi:hypothetical protein